MYFKPRRMIYDPSCIREEKNRKNPNDKTWSKTGGERLREKKERWDEKIIQADFNPENKRVVQ